MFRGVFVRAGSRIGWAASYQITMAGLAASRLFAAGGAGGLVLTAWALRRAGMAQAHGRRQDDLVPRPDLPALRVAVVVCGFGLHWGLFSGERPVLADVRARRRRRRAAGARAGDRVHPDRPAAAAAPFARAQGPARAARPSSSPRRPPPTSAGVRDALEHLRSRDPALLGAVLFWAFQIAVLWAAFHAFGDAPPLAVLVAGVLRRDARQPAADARRRRRRGGRHDRRVRRLRRRQRPGGRRGARLPRVHVLAAAAAGRVRLLPAAPHGRDAGSTSEPPRPPRERLHYTK